MNTLTRRALLIGGGLSLTGLTALNWKTLSRAKGWDPLLIAGDHFNYYAQRIAIPHRPLAKEYSRSKISQNHPSTGGIGASYVDPNPAYDRLHAENFCSWKLRIHGLVERPLALTLPQLRALPTRSQITMHSCDEGWSAIAEWTGVQMAYLLRLTGIKPGARYAVFRCLDSIQKAQCFTTLDLLDTLHPQTLIAHTINGQPLPVRHGAPARLRIELQIGYKNMKHLESIELVDSIKHLGRGGISENFGYQWYAGM